MNQARKRRVRKEQEERELKEKVALQEAINKLPTILFFYASRSFMDPNFVKNDFWVEAIDILFKTNKIKDYRIVWRDKEVKQITTDGHFICYPTMDIPVFESDILFLRGNQTTLTPFIAKKEHWKLAYRGGTKYEVPGINITFDDFIESPCIIDGHLKLPFVKPTTSCFSYNKEADTPYDFCIGGNNIYDKKGQYRSYATITLYNRWANKFSHCISPGAAWTENPGTHYFIQQDVEFPGIVSRLEMVSIYQRSKIFIHSTNNGQNDRCIVEALACGCPVMLHKDSYRFFPRYIQECPYVVPFDNNDPLAIISSVNKTLSFNRKDISNFTRKNYNINILCDKMSNIIKYIGVNCIPTEENLKGLL